MMVIVFKSCFKYVVEFDNLKKFSAVFKEITSDLVPIE